VSDDEPVLAEVIRSGLVESVHRGSIVALDGGRILTRGDVRRPVFGRSSNKPLQAVAMVRCGLDLPGDLLTLVCASHSGEAIHLDAVRRILAGAGLDESFLGNIAAYPLGDEAAWRWVADGGEPATVTMNCSGKHAGMLATCVVNGWPTAGYLEPTHPLQRAIATAVADLAGEPVRAIGVDGCGAPVHAVSLMGLAKAFRAIATAPPDTAEGRVAAAMSGHPDLLGGTERDVTRIVAGIPGIVAKDGAEGVYAAALPDGRAVALKIADGSGRARAAVLLAQLASLGVDTSAVADLRIVPVWGGGRIVGEIRAVLR
jgi:L-asparaginase II